MMINGMCYIRNALIHNRGKNRLRIRVILTVAPYYRKAETAMKGENDYHGAAMAW